MVRPTWRRDTAVLPRSAGTSSPPHASFVVHRSIHQIMVIAPLPGPELGAKGTSANESDKIPACLSLKS